VYHRASDVPEPTECMVNRQNLIELYQSSSSIFIIKLYLDSQFLTSELKMSEGLLNTKYYWCPIKN
jgi:hypothetical protein